MTYTTSTLGMQLAVPGTGQAHETTVVNGNLLILESAIISANAEIETLGDAQSGFADDITALEALTGGKTTPDIIISNTPMTTGTPVGRVRLGTA